ncbi:MAG: glycosyltransferase family 2 protein, partial [Owenweeksia sp.]
MISIVIPIYNEEEVIPKLIARLKSASPLWKDSFEVVLVDDGSRDASLELLKAESEKDSRFRVVKLSRNFGHQAAISAGIWEAKGDAVIVMDGDLQDPPEELPRFLEKWREGYEVVYAVRTKRKEGPFKKMAYKIFYRILRVISDIEIPLDSGDFCVMDRKVVDTLKYKMPEKIRFVRGLRAYSGFKQIGVKYERSERAAGEVKYTFR